MLRIASIVVLALLLGAGGALYFVHEVTPTGAAVALAPQRVAPLVATAVATARPQPTATKRPTVTPAPTETPAPTATPAPPPQPLVQSPSNPNPKVWYAAKDVTLHWSEPNSVAINGYSYLIDQTATSSAPPTLRTADQTVTLSDLKDGVWYVHVRALGAAGQWGPSASFQFNLDRVALSVTIPKFSAFTFNPHFFTQDFWFDVSKPAQVTVVVQGSTGAPVRAFYAQQPRAGEVDLTWDGKTDKGGIAQPGKYSYLVKADDGHGHQASSQASGLSVTYDRIMVSLSQQSLTAYDGNTPVLTTLVTTGNQVLPTPVGVFPVLGKYSPFTFHSPWPKGSPYWYADSPVTYALLFDDRGYFIHDSPWRSDYGPGSNAKPGTPGQNLTGSHGCVNVPLAIAKQLYDWAPTGTAVQVVP